MSYLDEGSGPPLVFVHGTPTWSFEYRHLIKALAPRFRCLAPDHLGFGLSERPAGASYDPASHAARLRAWVEALGLREFSLVVHDFGGPIGLPLALDASLGVKNLVIFNAWMWSLAEDPLMRRRARLAASWLGRWMYRRLNASLRLIMPSAYGDRRLLTPSIHRQYLSVFKDFDGRERVLWALARALLGSSLFYDSLWARRASLARLPVLLCWGERDSAFQPYVLARWREIVPQAKVCALPRAGHWPHEEDPAAVLAAVQAFFAHEAPGRGEFLRADVDPGAIRSSS